MSGIVFAISTAVVAHGGQRIPVRAGEAWDADDPLVGQYPGMFTEQPRAVRITTDPRSDHRVVEQATAAPGEKRTTRRPRRPRG